MADYVSEDSPAKSFIFKDWLTFGFSVAALLLSGLTFYFSNLRAEDNLEARVADVSLDSPKNGDPNKDEYMVARIALINAGNRPAVVLASQYFFAGVPDMEHGAFGGNCKTAKGVLPELIQGGDIRILEVRIPLEGLPLNINTGGPLQNPPWNEPGKSASFFTFLSFATVNSRGEAFDTITGAFATVYVHEKGYTHLRTIDNKAFKTTKLFRNVHSRVQITPDH